MYGDKLIEDKDMVSFAKIKKEIVKTSFEVSVMLEQHINQHIHPVYQDLGFLRGLCIALIQPDQLSCLGSSVVEHPA